MPQCAVNSCRNSHRRTRGRPIKYHRFPPVPEVRDLWVRACNRPTLPNGEPSFNLQTARVCSLHFTEESYEGNIQQPESSKCSNRLRYGILPMLFLDPGIQELMKNLSKSLKLEMPVKAVRARNPRSNANKSRASKNSDKATANKDIVNVAEAGTSGESAPSTSNGSSSPDTSHGNVDDIITSNDSRPSTSCSSDGPSTSRISDGPSTSRGSTNSSTSRDNVDQPEPGPSGVVGEDISINEVSNEQASPLSSSQERQQQENQQQQLPVNPQQEPENQRQSTRPRRPAATRRQQPGTQEPPMQQPRANKRKRGISPPPTCKELEMRKTFLDMMPENHGMQVLLGVDLWPKNCLNRMHALMSEYGKNVKDAGKNSRKSPKASPNNIPQSQQNGAALPEEASTSSAVDKQSHCSTKKSSKSPTGTSRQKTKSNSNAVTNRKRKPASEEEESIGELPVFKKCCLADREKHIENLVGQKEGTSEEFARRAEELRLQIEALDQLAHNKEKEWNNILSMRKLKEEAYLRLKRMTEVANFMESGNNLGPESVPLTNLWVEPIASGSGDTSMLKEKSITKENLSEIVSQDSMDTKKHNIGKVVVQQETASPKNSKEDDRKQGETSNTVTRKLTEGRQGTKVPVQSIIDDYRSRNPEIVPRRGRRMRNSVNVGLTAGGAMVETGHNVDSRPSSTDSSKSNSNAPDSNNPMSFKDVLIQFARMSQQGEPIKTPQNYPDVTLHPVPPSTTSQSTAPQQSASLLHGILTKAQTPKPATFSPTLAKLLTAPERERSSPTATAIVTAAPTTSSATIVTATAAVPIPQQGTSATQHLLQAYHGSNLGAISELLSSSKARSEITITPVVNPPASQSHSNNVIHVEDVEEESAVIDDREGRYSAVVRDNREERDNPRCQGCQDRAAQFVCAGCGNQWYCSRDCQVAAWDEHSEVCSG